jgi:hypothetical protein
MTICSMLKAFIPYALIYFKLNYCYEMLVVIEMKVPHIDVEEVMLSNFFIAQDVFQVNG